MKGSTSYEEYKKMLIKTSGNRVGARRTVEMHLYWLTTLKLCESLQERPVRYSRTALGDTFCELRSNSFDLAPYRSYLSSLLLRIPEVASSFDRFLEIVRKRVEADNPISTTEVKPLFPNETFRALHTLSLEAGLITNHNGILGLLHREERLNVSLDRFKSELVRAYRAIQKRQLSLIQLRPIYVEISKVRDVLLAILGIAENDWFDSMFTRLLDSPEGRDVHLYGAAPQYLSETKAGKNTRRKRARLEEGFRYDGKIYVLMSIS